MEAVAVKKQSPVLMPDRFGLAEHKRSDWVADLPPSVSLEEALEPGYWAHVAEQMNPCDNIEVRAEDGSWFAELRVVMCERNYARVKLLRKYDISVDMSTPSSSVKHFVDWKGPHHKFCVIRSSDSQIVHSGEKDKQVAITWMIEHEKTLSR